MTNNEPKKNPSGIQKANRLVEESSPYLQQHAYNPIDWYPWGDEALNKAKEENKPILVSIGYSACHWCHVMEKESFKDEEVAELMNEHFVNIKVDREERPDIDQVYMDAVQAMNINGGWPLNVFLMPDTKPFYGGTYFPPAHWTHLLKQISKAFENNREELETSAEEFTKVLRHSEVTKYGLSDTSETLDPSDLDKAYENLAKNFDGKWGGTGTEPKFPMPSIYGFLLRYYLKTGKEEALRHLKLTLDKMAYGGIYDQAGGGFARYSTDENWLVPHFEKMLYDNGQLISLYSQAYAVTKDNNYKSIVLQSIEWLKKEMTSEEGGFYSALDADSEGEEGKYYVWSAEELKHIIPNDSFELFKDYYNIQTRGNWEQEKNILHKTLSDKAFSNKHSLSPEELKALKEKWLRLLLDVREQREKPGTDDKILASWNGIMLKGLIDAYRFLKQDELLDLILQNANFIKDKLSREDRISHTYKDGKASQEGYLEDYALVIKAYIALYQATGKEDWLQLADKHMSYVMKNFFDPVEELFYFTDIESEKLIARKKEIFDNVIPASNSVMAENLLWLGKILDKADYIDLSYKMLSRTKNILTTDPDFLSNWASLFVTLSSPIAEVVIVGPDFNNIRKEIDSAFIPSMVICGTKEKSTLPLLKNRIAINNKTTIYVCVDKTCKLPVHTSAEALEQIKNLR
ncbi:thioredoxin domain-containing protein [Cytophagaceae bacterium ABcell3]|nr:thioredoxin domain-containing protein [Cytophagaceae bacterium ABcell3]